MAITRADLSIDEYLRKRLMPVEGAIPQLVGIEMYGNSIPAGSVGGDVFEYINFQQRYNIDARIANALKLSTQYLQSPAKGEGPRNFVDAHVQWLETRPGYQPAIGLEYREAKQSEQIRIAEDLPDLYTIAGVLVVDAQGHDIISAKIASTVHDTFHSLMLAELDQYGKTTPQLFEKMNLRLAQSVTARNALGLDPNEKSREIATMLYGEIHVSGRFRFVNFGHPPPLIFSANLKKFVAVNREMVIQFPPLGLEIPEDYPDRSKYLSLHLRPRQIDASDVEEITLFNRGDVLLLYTDGVYDGSDEADRLRIERAIREHRNEPAKDICNAVLDEAVKQDDYFRKTGEKDRLDDKTVVILKRI
jgi:serine phosphatase RsbU (regulator of sigma subunit)